MEIYNSKTNLFLSKDRIDENALKQIDNISALSFVNGIAVMPDVHVGMGCCVGAVVATQGAIPPSIVGVDLGCGMMAVKTQFKRSDIKGDLAELRYSIERSI
ncbi:MAG: RtcB family protein, partial [Nanoarchaeota archaeon]